MKITQIQQYLPVYGVLSGEFLCFYFSQADGICILVQHPPLFLLCSLPTTFFFLIAFILSFISPPRPYAPSPYSVLKEFVFSFFPHWPSLFLFSVEHLSSCSPFSCLIFAYLLSVLIVCVGNVN